MLSLHWNCVYFVNTVHYFWYHYHSYHFVRLFFDLAARFNIAGGFFFLISISLLSILIIWLLLLTKGPFLCFLHPNWGSTTKVRFVFCFVWSLPCLFLLLNIFKVYGRRDFFLLNGGILSFSPTGFVFWMFFLVFTIFRKILLGLWVPPGPSTLLVFAMLACC